MAFSSEVRFKIGADTSALSKAFVAAQSIAANAGAIIHKKFGVKHLFQGLAQGIGIGSVEQISDLVVRPFEVAYERSKDLLSLTSRMREITSHEIVSTGGRREAIKAMRDEVSGLSREIEIQEKLVHDLDSSPIKWINPSHMAMLKEAEKELVNLKTRQAEVSSQISISNKNQKKETRAWAREESTVWDIHLATLRNASEREKLQIRLNALAREHAVIVREGNVGTEKERKNLTEYYALQAKLQLLRKTSREEEASHLIQFGREAARAPKGRGRSETERIAARGAKSLEDAREAMLQGKTPSFVGRLVQRGTRDLKKAGERIAKEGEAITRPDSKALGDELISANRTLREIRDNLRPVSAKQ